MSNLVKISVGILLSRANSLANFAVQSALCQSHINKEIIICDNFPDRDPYIVSTWTSKPFVKYINSGVNVGGHANTIRAFEASTSEYFMWLGDDDFLHPNALFVFSNAIENETDATTIAWYGVPSVFDNTSGSMYSGKVWPSIIDPSPHGRIGKVVKYGQWNYLYYSVYKKSTMPINTLRVLTDWPGGLTAVDWSWTYAVAQRGSTRIIKSQTHFYNTTNWSNSDDYTESCINSVVSNMQPPISTQINRESIYRLNCVWQHLFAALHCLEDPAPALIQELAFTFLVSSSSPGRSYLREIYKELGLRRSNTLGDIVTTTYQLMSQAYGEENWESYFGRNLSNDAMNLLLKSTMKGANNVFSLKNRLSLIPFRAHSFIAKTAVWKIFKARYHSFNQ